MSRTPSDPDSTAFPDQEHHMTQVHESADPSARRRPLDVTSLVAGVVVLVIAAAFAFGDPDSLHDQGRVIGPLVLLGVGVALLVGSLRH